MALTGPLTPAVPLPHVTAPASAAAPLVQSGLRHHVVAVAQGRHAAAAADTESFAVLPTRLFVALTAPLTPAVPLPHVTAPASAAAPLVQSGLLHHVVAVAQGRHAAAADVVAGVRTGESADQRAGRAIEQINRPGTRATRVVVRRCDDHVARAECDHRRAKVIARRRVWIDKLGEPGRQRCDLRTLPRIAVSSGWPERASAIGSAARHGRSAWCSQAKS